MTLVVDASAIAAIVFGEPDGDTIAAQLEDGTLVAPALIDYELASIGWKKLRRHPDRAGEMLASLARVRGLAITRVATPVMDVVTLALRTGLTAYDAAYLWVALSRDAELVTLDRQLARVNQALRERHV
jgi:predicted nucleic acid-binding protein